MVEFWHDRWASSILILASGLKLQTLPSCPGTTCMCRWALQSNPLGSLWPSYPPCLSLSTSFLSLRTSVSCLQCCRDFGETPDQPVHHVYLLQSCHRSDRAEILGKQRWDGKGQGEGEHGCGYQPQYLGQQGFLLLCHLPPDLGDLVDLRVEEAVLGPICFHVILGKSKVGQQWFRKHPAPGESPLKELLLKRPSRMTQRGSPKDFSREMWGSTLDLEFNMAAIAGPFLASGSPGWLPAH